MSNKYLEKIAEEKKKSNWKVGSAIGSSLIGGTVANLALGGAQIPVSSKVKSAINQSYSDSGADLHTVRKFMRDNQLHKTTTFNTRNHSIEKGISSKGFIGKVFKGMVENGRHGNSPTYVPSRHAAGTKDFIVGARGGGHPMKNADILMHELGHAKDFQSFGKLKTLGSLTRSPLYKAVTLGTLSNDKTRDYAPAVAAVPGAIMLRDEAAANYHAYKGIKAHKGAAAANKFVRKLLPSQMGTYAITAAAPVASAYLAKKIMDKWHPKKDK